MNFLFLNEKNEPKSFLDRFIFHYMVSLPLSSRLLVLPLVKCQLFVDHGLSLPVSAPLSLSISLMLLVPRDQFGAQPRRYLMLLDPTLYDQLLLGVDLLE
jgi:hypothetical protein